MTIIQNKTTLYDQKVEICNVKPGGISWCINTYSRTQLYLPLVLQKDYNNDMFRPYM